MISTEKRLVNITLDKDFKNIQTAPAYKITAPDGYSIIHKHCMSNGSAIRTVLSHCGAIVEEFFEDREVKGDFNVNGTTLKLIDPRVLQFESDSKRHATELYLKVIKPELISMGYRIVKKPECYPYIMKKIEPDCLKDTFGDVRQ